MKTSLAILLSLFTFFDSSAQKTIIKGEIPSMKGALVSIGRPTQRLFANTSKGVSTKTTISPTGSFSFNADYLNKEIITITIKDTGKDRRLFEQYFFITKGDNILITENENKTITISGNGANNNQLKGVSLFYNYGQTKQDSLPDRLYKVVNGFYEKDKSIVDSLVVAQKPSADFISAWNYHLKYARVSSLYYTYQDLNTGNQEVFLRNKSGWQNLFRTLQEEAPISDEKALVAPSYHQYLSLFLQTKCVDTRDDYFNVSQEFYKEWFDGDSVNGKAIMQKDFTNQLKQKIIERYSGGKVKEQMYALLFESMIENKEFTNVEAIYNDFKRQFPDSKFNQSFRKLLGEAISNTDRVLSKKVVFLEMKNWDDILTHFKGQTVFLDMWGSWCRPCREDISKYAADLKKQYKNKDLTFLYITNYDGEAKWKELIVFYKLEGNHIFASEELTKEIMRKIKGSGYPTYAIIDKYGKVEKTRAESLEEKGILNVQIEEALKR